MNFTTPLNILVNGIFNDEPAIDCEGVSGDKISNITIEDLMKASQQGFGNSVGSITNQGSSMYATISRFDKGSKEYEELDKRIKCIQLYQQYEIDRCKTGGEFKPLPSHWIDFRSDKVKINIDEESGEILDDDATLEMKKFNQLILTEKKPYYFNYIYDTMYSEYSKFEKSCRVASLRKFRCNVEELQAKDNRTESEDEFLMWYGKKMPTSNEPCIVNKIAWKVEDEFNNKFGRIKKDDFDWTIYQNKSNMEIANKSQMSKLKKLCEDYSKSKSNNYTIEVNDKESFVNDKMDRDELFISEVMELICDEDILLNSLLELSYNKASVGKWICWLVCGNSIIRNMLNNNNNQIYYPIRSNDGDIEYDGDLFEMVSMEVVVND